ncbi:MAG: hypothetical protein ACI9FJ_001313, partial [Alteromonadaceae bacterium]
STAVTDTTADKPGEGDTAEPIRAEPIRAEPTKAKPDKAEPTEAEAKTASQPVDDKNSAASKAEQPKKRSTGDFVPTESISEDLAVSFPVDI